MMPGAAAPAAAGGSSVPPPAAAQPGMVAPASPAAAAPAGGAGMASSAPMMLPPGSMGPPAAAVPPPAATMSAGTMGGGSNTPSSTTPPSTAGAGATLIPASVVAAGQTAAARERRESADAAAAKELAWKLQHAAQTVGYPAEWAVGVFRSPSGTETVVTSNDGASFIPAGVFIPRSVRVLATDPLVDDHFRLASGRGSDNGPRECAARCRSGTPTVVHTAVVATAAARPADPCSRPGRHARAPPGRVVA